MPGRTLRPLNAALPGPARVRLSAARQDRSVTTCGRICFIRQKINLSQIFAGQNVGIKQVSDRIWLVNFMDYNLGHVDNETCRLEPVENPFGSKVLPMPPL